MPTTRTILILEDNDERIAGFQKTVAEINGGFELIIWRDADSMIAECAEFFPCAALICLDHDLNPQPGVTTDPGTGLDVTKFLCDFLPVCPVLIHSSNTDRVYSMHNELRFAHWMVDRVGPLGTDWIETTWLRRVRELIAEHGNTWQANLPANHSERVERMQLSLDGLGIGDALGEMLSYQSANATRRLADNELPAGPWFHTDDTEMAISIVAVLKSHGELNQDALARRFARRFERDPDRGYGSTRPLYLNTPGYRVGCKDEVLVVKDKDRVIEEVRMRDVSHVALFGNVQISTQAIQSLCEQEVPVTYFSMGGWFYGITRGHALKNVFLRMEQFRLARDEATCLSLARQFVHGKIRNHRTLLMRNHLEPPEVIIGKLKRASEDALTAGSIEELLGIEGAAASQYFQQFNGMVKVEDDLPGLGLSVENTKQRMFNFNFNNRNRRPPTDPVNAMLSLAYSMLAKDCTLAALAVGFDPYLGFYHQPRFGRPALGLDLMEEFRPLVAESTVLSCINNRVVTDKDFVKAGQAVNLTAPGRKRFFQTYEQRMSSLITHPLFDYKVSYRRALELQARLLAKTLTGEITEYIPLMTR